MLHQLKIQDIKLLKYVKKLSLPKCFITNIIYMYSNHGHRFNDIVLKCDVFI